MRRGLPLMLLVAVSLGLVAAAPRARAACLLDGDGDGICDADDPCTNVNDVEIINSFLRLRKVDGGVASRIFFVGTLHMPTTPPIDPATHGLRVIITDALGAVVADVTVPPGDFDSTTKKGWRYDVTRTLEYYRDRSGSAGGIIRALMKVTDPIGGEVRVLVFGQNSAYPLPVELPVKATVVFDAPVSTSGQCGEGELPDCRFRNLGHKLLCTAPIQR